MADSSQTQNRTPTGGGDKSRRVLAPAGPTGDFAAVLGSLFVLLTLALLAPSPAYLIQPVTYELIRLQPSPLGLYWITYGLAVLIAMRAVGSALGVFDGKPAICSAGVPHRYKIRYVLFASGAAILVLMAWASGGRTASACLLLSLPLLGMSLRSAMVLGAGTISSLGRKAPEVAENPLRCEPVGNAPKVSGYGLWFIGTLFLVLVSTLWLYSKQVLLWRQYDLGYADFGLFTTELEHCLPYKPVGEDRFSHTRLGYHLIPLFYLLAPFYAFFRSPTFLMAVGPLAINLAAVAWARWVWRCSGSPWKAMSVAAAWLLLPSISRLPFANTYGFQSIFLAIPWLAFAFCFGLEGRWRLSTTCLAGGLLCEETVCAVALGWGLYITFLHGKRVLGCGIAIAAIAYVLAATIWIIPSFDVAGEYTRLRLFERSAADLNILSRLLRPEAGLYVLALLAPIIAAAWRRSGLLSAALPTLLLILLLANPNYLNIKYWHQSTMLPVFFMAAIAGVLAKKETEGRPGGGLADLWVPILLAHLWLAYSPLAVAGALARTAGPEPDDAARAEAVGWVKEHYEPAAFRVVSTERLAAHFTQYRMVHGRPWEHLGESARRDTLVIVDRADRWGGSEREIRKTEEEAERLGYRRVYDNGKVGVWAVVPDGRPARP